MRGLFQRWVYFVLGGALFAPYGLLVLVALPLALPEGWLPKDPVLATISAAAVIAVLVVATSWLPIVDTLESACVPVLLGGHATGLVIVRARTAGARFRHSCWYLAHTVLGAAVALAWVFVIPTGVRLLTAWGRSDPQVPLGLGGWAVARDYAAPLAAAALLAMIGVTAAAGAVASWCAPILLGPDPVARVEALERRTAELSSRTRLARELHDSIGHVLAVTILQAAAARRVLRTDPDFVANALSAIENTGRAAAQELDEILGLLRDEPAPGHVTSPTLGELEVLVDTHRDAGLPVVLRLCGNVGLLPEPVSREVYRIIQEGLTNVQRHAGLVPTSVHVVIDDETVTAEVRNAPPSSAGPPGGAGRGGGRGLAGVRDRARILGGQVSAGRPGREEWSSTDQGLDPIPRGPGTDGWLLTVRVPIGDDR
jgi:signal transduction histidine kinase